MAAVDSGVEILPKVSTFWVQRTNVTDDRRICDSKDPNVTYSRSGNKAGIHEIQYWTNNKMSWRSGNTYILLVLLADVGLFHESACFFGISFLQHVAMLCAVLAIAFLFVRPSVTRLHCVRMNKHRMMPSWLTGRAMYLVYGDIRLINIFARDHP